MIVNQALRPLTAAFQKKYPFIKMTYWRGDSEDIHTRMSTEMRANKLVADVVEGTGVGELAVRGGLAQPAWSPQLDGIPEYMRDPRRLWSPTRMSYFGIAYNTRLVAAGTAPKTYEDLLDPKWKGKMVWPALTPDRRAVVRHQSSPDLGRGQGDGVPASSCARRTSSTSAPEIHALWWTG